MASLSFATSLPAQFPHTYRFHVPKTCVRTFADPVNEKISLHHVYIPVSEFKREMLPDDVNPRSHEDLAGRIPRAIEKSLIESPNTFHLLNRGELVIAQKCVYDNQREILEITIEDPRSGGLADGGTTDRVIKNALAEAASRKGSEFTQEMVEESLSKAFVHLEVVSGNVDDLVVPLAGARNTSVQVKEFALDNLGGKFEWLKVLLESSKLKGKIRYRENDPEPVDIRTALALITMLHPKWTELKKDPLVAYTSKGSILSYFNDPEWLPGYQSLAPVVVDALTLFDYIHTQFPEQYRLYKAERDLGAKFGRRRDVGYKDGKLFHLALTGSDTKYQIADGWLYPLLASFRVLIDVTGGKARWELNPFTFFDEKGAELVGIIVEQSEAYGFNPQSVGKARPVWQNLRDKVEILKLKELASL